MVIGRNQLVLAGVLVAAIVAALVVFHRGEPKPQGSTVRTSEVTRAIRADLQDKAVCGFCMEPDAALHKIGGITLRDLGADVFQAAIGIECRATPDGRPRVKVLMREYAYVDGAAVCTMPNLGWRSPEAK
ncbi:MAG: hypothetical protein ACI4R9_06395 [Kiritimatiellia bacterium]